MRLDLFLKTSRLIKRRTVAQELCEAGKAFVNGREAKPAKEIKPGDTIRLVFSSRIVDLEVLDALETSPRKAAPHELYRVKEEKRLPKEKDLWRESPSSS